MPVVLSLVLSCSAPPAEECADEEHVADACNEVHCGEPTLEFGTGSRDFEPIADGDVIPIWYGGQGGYHLEISTRMEQLCDLVYIRTRMYADLGDGSETIADDQRYRQTDRIGEPHWSTQQFLGSAAFIPCQHWPEDPLRDPFCNTGEPGWAGPLETLDLVLRVEVRDRDERSAVEEKAVVAVCCEDGS